MEATDIDRRTMLRGFLTGAIVAAAGATTVGVTLMPEAAEAMPLANLRPLTPDDLVQKAQVIVVRPRRYRYGWSQPRWYRRRRRRWVCWWRRGRRVCGWQYW
jgi:hypothetical protein